MRTKPSFQWSHRSVSMLIAGVVTMLATGCVCLFACNDPPSRACMLPDEIRICKSALYIKLIDKNNPEHIWGSERGITKGFTLLIQSASHKDVEIICDSPNAENAQGLRPVCNFTSQDKVAMVSVENLSAEKINVTIEREGYKETFSDLALNYTKQVFDPCGPPGPSCNVANLTLEVE